MSALRKPAEETPASTVLHRRRQRVVVRRDTSLTVTSFVAERRGRTPTLVGLGARPAFDTVPDWVEALVDLTADAVCEDDEPPVSRVRRRIPPAAAVPQLASTAAPSIRPRPVTLLDDVDDERARGYLDEARRLLDSGVFDSDTRVTLVS